MESCRRRQQFADENESKDPYEARRTANGVPDPEYPEVRVR